MSPAVSTEKLSKTYAVRFSKRSVHALQDLSLEIQPGEVFGLLGPNGAGKTTLLKVLLGVIRPTSGSASLLGLPIDEPASRMQIGFLPENHRFPPFLTANQVLEIYGRLSNVSGPAIRERGRRLLERVGLTDWADVRIRQFSKGMMQRLGLAQALINAPKLLFLDEPTDGVDPIGRREIRDLLVSLKNDGMTVFLNSHLLSEVEMVCSRVGILHRGRMVQTGTISELTSGKNAYRFRFEAATGDMLNRLFPDLEIRQESGAFDGVSVGVTAETGSALNEWIDHFRASGLEILGIVPDQRSLEARFMEIIGSLDAEASYSTGLSSRETVTRTDDHAADRSAQPDATGGPL